MKKLIFIFICLVVGIIALPSAMASTYDLVILHGRVMDPETKYDQIANVGLVGNKIAIITKDNITGKKTIDAKGLVVAPGFIDTHFHWTRTMGYKLTLRDGVTSAMDLEVGALGTYVNKWYKERKGKTQLNYGTATSHEFARSLVLDKAIARDTLEAQKSRAVGNNWSNKKVNLKEGNKILKILDKGLRDGAIGIGSTVGYMRDGVTAREMFEVQKVAANYGRLTSVHLRYTPGDSTTEVNGAQEILTNAIALGAPAIIDHFNNPGWQLINELLVRLQQKGHNVWGEIYPYAAGSTALNAVFLTPEVWLDKLGYKYEDTLMDPATNKFYTRQTYEEDVKKDPTKIVILYKMPKEDIVKWLMLPEVTIGSDAMPIPGNWPWDTPYKDLPNTHPRTAGAHALALQLGRENHIPLMMTLAQLSYNSAKHLGASGLKSMQVRGRMQQGMVADITIFDPNKVKANSTYQHGAIPSTGIPYVIVDGVIVVKDSKVLKGVYPGQQIRFDPQRRGRFKPLSIKNWTKTFLVTPVDFCLPVNKQSIRKRS